MIRFNPLCNYLVPLSTGAARSYLKMINLPVPFNKAICTLSRRLATAASLYQCCWWRPTRKAGCGQHDGPVTGTTKASSVHLCQCPAHPSQHVAYQSNGCGHKSHERISKRCFASTVKQREGRSRLLPRKRWEQCP